MARRFSNPCFKLPRKADRGLAVVGGNGVAIVVAQINATNIRMVFILMEIKNCKKTPKWGKMGKNINEGTKIQQNIYLLLCGLFPKFYPFSWVVIVLRFAMRKERLVQ